MEICATMLLKQIEGFEVAEPDFSPGRLAVCESVMLTSLDLSRGDQVLVNHPEDLRIRFVLPRHTSSSPRG